MSQGVILEGSKRFTEDAIAQGFKIRFEGICSVEQKTTYQGGGWGVIVCALIIATNGRHNYRAHWRRIKVGTESSFAGPGCVLQQRHQLPICYYCSCYGDRYYIAPPCCVATPIIISWIHACFFCG